MMAEMARVIELSFIKLGIYEMKVVERGGRAATINLKTIKCDP